MSLTNGYQPGRTTCILIRLSRRLYIAPGKVLDRRPSREFGPAHRDGRNAGPAPTTAAAAAAAAAGQRPLATYVDIRTSSNGTPDERASSWASVLRLRRATGHGARATTDSATADERIVSDAGRTIYG